MYGFSVNCGFKSELNFREIWREIEGMRDFFRVKGYRLAGKEHGVEDPGFLSPLIFHERLSERRLLTVLNAPTTDLPSDIPEKPPQMCWGGHLRGEVLLQAEAGNSPRSRDWFFREWQDAKPLRILLLHVSTMHCGHGVGFWTESHVWLSDSPLNPIREFADDNLFALVSRVATLTQRFQKHLDYVTGNFHELKGPFGAEVDRLKKAFELVPKFSPYAG